MYYEKWSVEKTDTHMGQCFIPFKQNGHRLCQYTEILADHIIHLPKKAPYLNPNERKVNQQIKSDVCANRFYEHIEEQKTVVSEYLDKTFGRWNNDITYDT
jgi:hypothetical protein